MKRIKKIIIILTLLLIPAIVNGKELNLNQKSILEIAKENNIKINEITKIQFYSQQQSLTKENIINLNNGEIKIYKYNEKLIIESIGKIKLSENAKSFLQGEENANIVEILGLENLDTSLVKDFSYFFYNQKKVKKLNLSTFNTQNAINLEAMFLNMESLEELNINNFNTEKVQNMEKAFQNLACLRELDLRYFDTRNVTKSKDILKNTGSNMYHTSLWTLDKGDTYSKELGLIKSLKLDKNEATVKLVENKYKLNIELIEISNPKYDLIITSSSPSIAKIENDEVILLKPGKVKITVEAQDKKEILNLTILDEPYSNNKNIKELIINGRKYNTNNNIIQAQSTTKDKIKIEATLEDETSEIKGLGEKTLNLGKNEFNLTVTSEDKTEKKYTIIINKIVLSKDCMPKTIKINDTKYNIENNIINLPDTYQNEIKIEVEKNTSTQKITGDGIIKLNDGINKHKIIITAQNGTENIYEIEVNKLDKSKISTNIYTSSLNKIKEEITKIKEGYVEIQLENEEDIIPLEIIQLLKDNNKMLIISYTENQKLIYKWEINPLYIQNDFNPLVILQSKKSMDLKTKINTNFIMVEPKSEIEKYAKITVSAKDKYLENTELLLYKYENDKFELIKDDLLVENEQIEFPVEHKSTYIITREIINQEKEKESNKISTLYIIVISLILLIIITNIIIIIKIRKSK